MFLHSYKCNSFQETLSLSIFLSGVEHFFCFWLKSSACFAQFWLKHFLSVKQFLLLIMWVQLALKRVGATQHGVSWAHRSLPTNCPTFVVAPEWTGRVWNRTWYQGPEGPLFAGVLTGQVKNRPFVSGKKEPSSDLMVAQRNVKRPRGLCGEATPTPLKRRHVLRSFLRRRKKSLLVNKCLDPTWRTTTNWTLAASDRRFCESRKCIFCLPSPLNQTPAFQLGFHVLAFAGFTYGASDETRREDLRCQRQRLFRLTLREEITGDDERKNVSSAE